MLFQALNLLPELVQAIEELGYATPTPIQQQAIPIILDGQDIMALAQTGTGKTAGFALPLLHKLHLTAKPETTGKLRALILAPTRELADQIYNNINEYSKYLSFNSAVIYGGVNINAQIAKLKKCPDIIIATPGRLLDLIKQKIINLSKIEMFVLDEADRMLDLGFIWDIQTIMSLLPKNTQNMLFSATLPDKIQTLAKELLQNPKFIEIAKRNTTNELVSQKIYLVDKKRKRELLSHMIGFNNWKQVLVFTRTKHGANHLCEQLINDGLSAAAIHGNKSQGARVRALQDFKSGAIRVLVATDIAARGIDIDQLPHVVNFELPNIPEDYVHRIGRTGRAGAVGAAISLVCVDELHLLKDIESVIKRHLPREVMPGYEPDTSIKAEPIQNVRRSAGSNNRNSNNHVKNSNSTTERNASSTNKPRSASNGDRHSRSEDARSTPNGERRSNVGADRHSASNGNRHSRSEDYRSGSNGERRSTVGSDRRSASNGNRHSRSEDSRPASNGERRSTLNGERRSTVGPDYRSASNANRHSRSEGARPASNGERRSTVGPDYRSASNANRHSRPESARPASNGERRSTVGSDYRSASNGNRSATSNGNGRATYNGDNRSTSNGNRRSTSTGNGRATSNGERRLASNPDRR